MRLRYGELMNNILGEERIAQQLESTKYMRSSSDAPTLILIYSRNIIGVHPPNMGYVFITNAEAPTGRRSDMRKWRRDYNCCYLRSIKTKYEKTDGSNMG